MAQSRLSGKYGAHVTYTVAFVMQSGLLACGGVLAGVVQCGRWDYWWWTTDFCCRTEQIVDKLGVEEAGGQSSFSGK